MSDFLSNNSVVDIDLIKIKYNEHGINTLMYNSMSRGYYLANPGTDEQKHKKSSFSYRKYNEFLGKFNEKMKQMGLAESDLFLD